MVFVQMVFSTVIPFKATAIESVTRGKLDKYKESVMYGCDCHVLLCDDKRDMTWLLELVWMYAEF